MKSKLTAYSLGLLLWLLNASSALCTTPLEASLDRTHLAQGETVTLTLTAEGDEQGNPDLTPLRHDFDILQQGQSTRVSIINGRSSSIKEWQLVLAPRRSGTLTVPALQMGNTQSRPVTLEVMPPGQGAKSNSEQPFFVEVEAGPQDPYVQSAVHYTVRVLSRVPLRRAALTEPVAANAVVEQIGEDRTYSAYRHGARYDVIERRYAVFPQQSGNLTIQAPALSAAVPSPSAHRRSLTQRFLGHDPFAGFPDFDSFFEELRLIRLQGKNITLQVKPQPAGTALPWLPAKSLEISESWSPEPPEFRVGQPATRTITITATGLSSAQLPELDPPDLVGLKIYPDKSNAEDRARGADLVATKAIKTALVPTRAGKFMLPQTRIAWWDIESNQQRTASLPAHIFEVMSAANGSPLADSNEVETPQQTAQPGRAEARDTAVESQGVISSTLRAIPSPPFPSSRWWPGVASGLGFAWLATLALWWWTRGHRVHRGAPAARNQPGADTERRALKRVREACETNDPRATRKALLAWGRIRWPENPPQGLQSLGAQLGGSAPAVLQQLDRHLYAARDEQWKGTGVWHELLPLIRQVAAARKRTHQESPLPSLYPQAT